MVSGVAAKAAIPFLVNDLFLSKLHNLFKLLYAGQCTRVSRAVNVWMQCGICAYAGRQIIVLLDAKVRKVCQSTSIYLQKISYCGGLLEAISLQRYEKI